MDARIVVAADELREHTAAWDELAELHGLPFCSPQWMLAWWSERAPAGSELRVVLAVDRGTLVGLFPWYREGPAARVRVWRQLCAGFCTRVGPLVAPGREAAVAEVVAPLIAGEGGPHILALEGLPGGSPWPSLIRAAWPRRLPPLVHRDLSMRAPTAHIGDGFDEWLARRSKTLRRDVPRLRRRLEERGVTVRLARPEELVWAVGALCDLYRARWEWRGGSERLSHGLEDMLVAAGRALGDRFQLWLLDHAGEPVGAVLFVRAGPLLSDWGGGFHADWAQFSPTYVLRLAAVEHAARQGITRVEFGEGTQPDKLRFADGDVGIEWLMLLPRGRHYPLVRARLLPMHLHSRARAAARRLPAPLRERLRRIVAARRAARRGR